MSSRPADRLVFVSSVTAGGSGRSQRELAHRLQRRGWDVVIVSDDHRAAFPRRGLADRMHDGAVRFEGNPLGSLFGAMRRVFVGPSSRGEIDGVPHVFSLAPEFHLPAACDPIPAAVIGSSIARPAWTTILAYCAEAGIPTALYLREDEALGHLPHRGGDHTIANSQTLVAGAAARGVEAAFVPSVIELAPMPAPPSGEVALLVNPVATHGLDRVAPLAAARPDISIVLQESWPLNEAQRTTIGELTDRFPNVTFRSRRDPSVLFDDTRLLLAPHEVDNRPRTVLEAQVNGIPAIAADQPGLREQVGGAGVLLPLDADDSAWIDTVGGVWDDEDRRRALGETAIAWATRDEIDPDAVTDRFLAALGLPSHPDTRDEPPSVHVAVITNSLFRSDGIATSSLQIAQALMAAGNDVSLVYPDRPYDQPRLADWEASGATSVPVRDLSIRRRDLRRTASGLFTAWRTIRRIDADVLHVHQPSHAALAGLAALRRRTKVVLHLRGAAPDTPGLAQRIGLRLADVIIPVSAATGRSWVPHGARPDKITVVHNGIDLDDYRPPTDAERASARAVLGIDDDRPVIGFVGRFTDAKGVFVLADAYRALAESGTEAWLVCVGAAEAQAAERARLDDRLADHPRVRLLDAVADTRPIMAAFDVGAVVSDSEAFSRVVLELLATGVPVCATAVGGTPEALGDELAHLLSTFGDADTVATQLAEVLGADDPEPLRALARGRAERFGLTTCLERNVAILTAAAD